VTKPTPRRNAVAIAAMTLVMFALGLTLAVSVTGSASAAGSKTTTKKTATTRSTATTTAATPTPTPAPGPDTNAPGAHYFVINATVNAASDHEIVASSAFPNYTTGAIDNYYSLAHSHVDNSPFAEGTASPFDTGPIGQTAAAGNTQQPQYADARWPGDPGKATYGNKGGPYAAAEAGAFRATAEASEASNGLSGPGPTGAMTLAVPKGFDGRLRQALTAWKAKWQGRLAPKKPAPSVTTPVATVTVPKTGVTVPKPGITVPKPGVAVPKASVTVPTATVPTPPATGGGATPTPPVTVPAPTVPSPTPTLPSRSLASASTTPGDGESLLASSTLAALDPKTDKLVTSGESSLGRVSIGGGQIVIEGIHVTASITNDGTPTHKYAVSVGAASIGGVPITIDQDGFHVSGQGQALPFQQASDALNGALKQAGIQLFLVAPEITTNSCGQTGAASGTGGGTTTTTTPSDQSATGAPSSCDQTGMTTACDQTGTGTGNNTTTTTGTGSGLPTPATTSPTTTTTSNKTTTTSNKTTTTSTNQADTTSTTSSCDATGGTPTTSSCQTGTATGTTTTSSDQTGTTTTPTSPGDQTGMAATDTTSSGAETVTVTGVHVVFTQPVNQSGVPAQYVEHILGEVFVDSLAVPAGPVPNLDLSSSSSSSSSSCPGDGHSSGRTTSGGGSAAGGGTSAGGSTSSGSLSPSGSGFGSTSQPTSSSLGNSLPAAFAALLKKPLWLLLAYVLWQALVIGTGASLWNWRRGDAA
jgi:hypothetical protein